MVELAPGALLDAPWPPLREQLAAAAALLRAELDGAELDFMFQAGLGGGGRAGGSRVRGG